MAKREAKTLSAKAQARVQRQLLGNHGPVVLNANDNYNEADLQDLKERICRMSAFELAEIATWLDGYVSCLTGSLATQYA